MTSGPLPITAIVRPPASRAALWTMASTPLASPLTTVTPERARSKAIWYATCRPYAVGFRVPTTATDRSSSGRISPRR